MALTTQQKLDIRGEWGSELSRRREPFGLRKPDLDAAISAVDAWVEANAASYNAALPQPARGVLTAAQKAELLLLVVKKRFGG